MTELRELSTTEMTAADGGSVAVVVALVTIAAVTITAMMLRENAV